MQDTNEGTAAGAVYKCTSAPIPTLIPIPIEGIRYTLVFQPMHS